MHSDSKCILMCHHQCLKLGKWPKHPNLFMYTYVPFILSFWHDFLRGKWYESDLKKIVHIIDNVRMVQVRVVYDRVRKRKNYFEIPTFLQIEWGKSRAGKFKTSNENKNFFVFLFWFWISCSWSSSFIIQKGCNFKIIFLVPYPIIYR